MIITREISVEIKTFNNLCDVEMDLLSAAIEVRERAQAPYSHYKVGAALRSQRGRKFDLHAGCNVERGSYTQTTHAEQNALDSMVAMRGSGTKVAAIAIVAGPEALSDTVLREQIRNPSSEDDLQKDPLTFVDMPVPCGHCLQCIWENCLDDSGVRLLSVTRHGYIAITTIGDAFPMCFGPKDLGIEYGK